MTEFNELLAAKRRYPKMPAVIALLSFQEDRANGGFTRDIDRERGGFAAVRNGVFRDVFRGRHIYMMRRDRLDLVMAIPCKVPVGWTGGNSCSTTIETTTRRGYSLSIDVIGFGARLHRADQTHRDVMARELRSARRELARAVAEKEAA